MAVGGLADIVIRDEQVQDAVVEAIAQNLAVFNGVSNGALSLVDEHYAGNYDHRIFWGNLSGFATRRDSSSTSAASGGDIKKLSELDEIGVKVDNKIIIQEQELFFAKSLAKMDWSEEMFTNNFAAALTEAMLEKQLQDALTVAVAAVAGETDSTLDITGETTKTASKGALNRALAKMGDQRQKIRCLVMHSDSESQLITEQLGDAVTGIGDFTLRTGTIQTLGIPYVVTDSTSLQVTTGTGTGAVTDNYVLALVEDAVRVTNSEPYNMRFGYVPGQENATWEIRFDGANNYRAKGFQWDVTNGGRNPTSATLGTVTNWDRIVGVKNASGIALKHRASA